MTFYNNYKNKVQLNGQSIREQKIKAKNDLMISSFKDAPEYTQVTKNFNYNKFYDTWIYEGKQKDELVGYKYLKSYPYEEVQFNIGDYIHFTYGGEDKTWTHHGNYETWIISSINKQHTFDVTGRIKRCNNYLKWIDENDITRTYPCCIDEKSSNSQFDVNQSIIIAKGLIFITVQENIYTKNLKINQRFLFDNQAFKITNINNLTDNHIMLLILFKDNISPYDDLISGIADNKNIITSTTTTENSTETLW